MANYYTITVNDQEAITELANRMAAASDKALGYLAKDVWAGMGKEAPTDQGKLASSFALSKEGMLRYKIKSGTMYALFVHEGTGIYGPVGSPIRPKNAPRLRFTWKGRNWALKSVKGQKPNPYADRAITASEQRTNQFIQAALAET